jgi:hypothetical protein
MAITISSARLRVRVECTQVNAGDLSSATDALNYSIDQAFTDGTGASQLKRSVQDTRSLGTGATEDLDFAGGLTDAFGNAITFTVLKLLYIKAADANTTNLTISRPAANGLVLFAGASDALAVLKPGGVFLFTDPSAAGLTVTAGTGDLLTITNSAGATAAYDLIVWGEA